MKSGQWTVHETGGGLALVVQSHLIDALGTRLVVPVLPSAEVGAFPERLVPVVATGDETLHAVVPGLTSLPSGYLGRPIFDASDSADEIVRAIDMLLSGV